MITCNELAYEPVSCSDSVYSSIKASVFLKRLYGKFYFLENEYLGVITKIGKDSVVFVSKNTYTDKYEKFTLFISIKQHKFKAKQ